MKRTLVIHPKDITTDCLSVIYEGKEDWEVIRRPSTSRQEVEEAILRADRVIMLGHGTPEGLLAGGARGRFDHYIIDDSFTRLLAEKETYSIWCNSNAFFEGIEKRQVFQGTEYIIFDEHVRRERLALFRFPAYRVLSIRASIHICHRPKRISCRLRGSAFPV